ncbi:hypothetical protein B0G80_2120 [Paraburkholderia sp. BL6669N2]|uniref:helix-turn-helix domain-containing protein n=1 Tax=Paraburkholderia sp. BL6669N2 TaxID=1938807 RepID=UPI000E2706EF|nr:hypothetical protein B0G80_2120 [Paraburkholderia sp. BL6669N2]
MMRGELLSVAEIARLLNVSPGYVRKRLMRKHVLSPIIVRRGRKYALRAKAEDYSKKRSKIERRALRELAIVSQEAELYEKTKAGISRC